MSVIDNATTQITDKALIELVARLAPFFKNRASAAGTGGGGITEITSDDNTVTVVNPFGPIVDLAVAVITGFIRFNSANTDEAMRWLELTLNDVDGDGFGLHVHDESGGGAKIESDDTLGLFGKPVDVNVTGDGDTQVGSLSSEGDINLQTGNGDIKVETNGDTDGDLYVRTLDGGALTILSTAELTITKAGGADPLLITAHEILLDDGNAGDQGILIRSGDFDTPYTELSYVQVSSPNVFARLGTGGVFDVANKVGVAILQTDEATGVTTGTFDGGSP